MTIQKFRQWIVGVAAMCVASLALAAVDVNQASEAELDGVKGIGPATTKLILQERQTAPFTDWADFTKRVKGIGAKRASKLSGEGLVVNGKPWDASTAPTATVDKKARELSRNPRGTPLKPEPKAQAAPDGK